MVLIVMMSLSNYAWPEAGLSTGLMLKIKLIYMQKQKKRLILNKSENEERA